MSDVTEIRLFKCFLHIVQVIQQFLHHCDHSGQKKMALTAFTDFTPVR